MMTSMAAFAFALAVAHAATECAHGILPTLPDAHGHAAMDDAELLAKTPVFVLARRDPALRARIGADWADAGVSHIVRRLSSRASV